ncbi:hypothetical protein KPL70_004213 [Citrus sinensis]|nr:hypothetical protein KPL70_004213 [Citrus sinensis]
MKSKGSDVRIMPGSVERRPAPSLVDLCVKVVIGNIRYLGDVGETDSHLLEQILPHCTRDQLMHVENSTIGRDLSPVTDELWMKFYKKDFGEKNFNLVIERMKKKKVAFRWKQLYEAKTKDVFEAENVAANRLKQLYQKADARNGPGYGISGGKSSLMKKAKLDLLKSQEFKNLAAMKKNAVQRTYSPAPAKGSSVFSSKASGSTSNHSKPLEKNLKWVTFHGLYDIAFFVKISTSDAMPPAAEAFAMKLSTEIIILRSHSGSDSDCLPLIPPNPIPSYAPTTVYTPSDPPLPLSHYSLWSLLVVHMGYLMFTQLLYTLKSMHRVS